MPFLFCVIGITCWFISTLNIQLSFTAECLFSRSNRRVSFIIIYKEYNENNELKNSHIRENSGYAETEIWGKMSSFTHIIDHLFTMPFMVGIQRQRQIMYSGTWTWWILQNGVSPNHAVAFLHVWTNYHRSKVVYHVAINQKLECMAHMFT